MKKFRFGWAEGTHEYHAIRENCAINCAIQDVRLILIGHLWVSLIIDQSECLICFLVLHWINSFLHCFKEKKTALLLTNQNGEFFSCILLVIKAWSKAVSQTCLRSIFSGTQRGIKTVENYSCFLRCQIVLLYFSWQEF